MNTHPRILRVGEEPPPLSEGGSASPSKPTPTRGTDRRGNRPGDRDGGDFRHGVLLRCTNGCTNLVQRKSIGGNC